jgi:uncharacterized membrane protein (UPF0127 family)
LVGEPPPASGPNRRWSRWVVAAFVAVVLGVTGISLATNLARLWSGETASSLGAPSSAPVPAGFEPLTILTTDARHRLNVEVVRTPESRAQGLMFRRTLAPDAGMLFDFEREQMVSMWMKNTYLSLDMLFVRADGIIHRIEASTEPLSERSISSGAPVRAVLELNAGTAARLGLRPGDRLIHPLFR